MAGLSSINFPNNDTNVLNVKVAGTVDHFRSRSSGGDGDHQDHRHGAGNDTLTLRRLGQLYEFTGGIGTTSDLGTGSATINLTSGYWLQTLSGDGRVYPPASRCDRGHRRDGQCVIDLRAQTERLSGSSAGGQRHDQRRRGRRHDRRRRRATTRSPSTVRTFRLPAAPTRSTAEQAMTCSISTPVISSHGGSIDCGADDGTEHRDQI